jgi:hypothetical protein
VNGACPIDAVVGHHIKAYNTSVYPGAICHVPDGDTLRDDYADEFKGMPAVAILASQGPPKVHTHAEAVASGRANERCEKKKKDFEYATAYKAVDQWTKLKAKGWDKIKAILIDEAHTMHNFVKDLLKLLQNEKGMKFTPARRKFEVSIGRFTDLSDKVTLLNIAHTTQYCTFDTILHIPHNIVPLIQY